MKLWPNSDHLSDFIPPDSMLSRWGDGGSFRFDLDAYISQRAAAEGVDPGSEVRRFGDIVVTGTEDGASSAAAANESAMNASLKMSLKDVMSMTAIDGAETSAGNATESIDGVVHADVLMKRGGGGAFGNLKWKKKYAHNYTCR